jgi:hypothetical protein
MSPKLVPSLRYLPHTITDAILHPAVSLTWMASCVFVLQETFLVCLRRYGLNVQNTKQLVDDTWNMVVSTTQSLRSMKRTGVAVGLAARNAAVLRWGSELALPTPVTAQLLDANRNN